MTMTSASTLGTTSQLDGTHSHGAQRVCFLIELHDADLRRKGAAGTAGDDDGRQQHAPISRRTAIVIRSTTNMSAPKRDSCCAPR